VKRNMLAACRYGTATSAAGRRCRPARPFDRRRGIPCRADGVGFTLLLSHATFLEQPGGRFIDALLAKASSIPMASWEAVVIRPPPASLSASVDVTDARKKQGAS